MHPDVRLGYAYDAVREWSYDHIITDPPYDSQPDVDHLRRFCRGTIILFCDPMRRPAVDPDEILFWIKTPSTKNTSKRCSRFVEEIFVYHGNSTVFNRQHWSVMTGGFFDTLIEPTIHPWQKPRSLMEKLIRIYTNEGQTVLDPYAGSGTTLYAVEQCQRKSLGCDTDPKWGKANAE
jgi:DNA modification methylase